jgi:hypothetical protein
VRPAPRELALRYVVTGALGDVRWPQAAAATRADGLWEHTCFEAFVKSAGDESYFEFNFSPSTQWAAYQFDAYRAGERESEIGAPRIALQSSGDRYELRATCPSPQASGLARLGLAAVIEETNGNKSYWALAHAPGKADFHHADSFAVDLPAVEIT